MLRRLSISFAPLLVLFLAQTLRWFVLGEGKRIEYGGVPEWPKGADCKSVVSDFGGSNPPSPTTISGRIMRPLSFYAKSPKSGLNTGFSALFAFSRNP